MKSVSDLRPMAKSPPREKESGALVRSFVVLWLAEAGFFGRVFLFSWVRKETGLHYG